MATNQRRGGLIQLAVDGVIYDCKGAFTANLGRGKKDAIIGSDRVHGYMEKPQVPFIEGAITDRGDLDLNKLVTLTSSTITLTMANGKTIALSGAWYAGEGTVSTEEGEISVRFEGLNAEEISA